MSNSDVTEQKPETIVIAGKTYTKDPEVIYFPTAEQLSQQVEELRAEYSAPAPKNDATLPTVK